MAKQHGTECNETLSEMSERRSRRVLYDQGKYSLVKCTYLTARDIVDYSSPGRGGVGVGVAGCVKEQESTTVHAKETFQVVYLTCAATGMIHTRTHTHMHTNTLTQT